MTDELLDPRCRNKVSMKKKVKSIVGRWEYIVGGRSKHWQRRCGRMVNVGTVALT